VAGGGEFFGGEGVGPVVADADLCDGAADGLAERNGQSAENGVDAVAAKGLHGCSTDRIRAREVSCKIMQMRVKLFHVEQLSQLLRLRYRMEMRVSI
jgi:hypothetical protein